MNAKWRGKPLSKYQRSNVGTTVTSIYLLLFDFFVSWGIVWKYGFVVIKSSMGNYIFYDKPDYIPDSGFEPSFPPDYGFSGPRKVRESTVSIEEMKAMQVPPKLRDYCAHILREYYLCRKANAPFIGACKSYVHQYHDCQYHDYIMRMKEFEREKRLRIREKKLEGQVIN